VLYIIWSVTGLLLNVPAGALADRMSRRALLVAAGLLRAMGYALWVITPTFTGFAVGFVLWGTGGALISGTFEALVYDEAVAAGAEHDYGRLTGRAGTIKLISSAAVTLLAIPLLHVGGFILVGAVSAAVMLIWSLIASTMPSRPRVAQADDEGGFRGYLATLRTGVVEAATRPGVRGVLVIAALLPALTSIDEYVPLLGPAYRLPTSAVPLLSLGITLTAAVGNWAAGRWWSARSGRIALTLAAAGGALLASGLAGPAAGFAGVAAAFGLMQFGIVATNVRLQHAITGSTRATVTSLADFGADIGAIVVFAVCGLASPHLSVTALIAWFGVPLIGLAVLARKWLALQRNGTGSG
jgi:MFS family permease